MIQQINQLIDCNLQLLMASPLHRITLDNFKDIDGNRLADSKILAEIMQRKDLIRLIPLQQPAYELTDFGKQIIENDGWLMHLEKLKAINREYKAADQSETAVIPVWKQFLHSLSRMFLGKSS